jgi:hypothetical protein
MEAIGLILPPVAPVCSSIERESRASDLSLEARDFCEESSHDEVRHCWSPS